HAAPTAALDSREPVSCVAYEPSRFVNFPGILAVGTVDGQVSVYKALSTGFQLHARVVEQSSPISSLLIHPSLLVTGSEDGSIYIYDTVNVTLLRGLNNKHRNQNILQDRFRVVGIDFVGSFLAVSQAQGVTTWTRRPKPARTPKKPVAKVPIAYSRALSASGSSRKEIKEDVVAAMTEVQQARTNLAMERKRVEKINGKLQDHNMSEQELMEYAQFLSLQATSAGHSGGQPDQASLSEQEAMDLALA
ncbi:hypothetical protein HDU91_002575, partial [Kappamyces sp. JEL0680]